MEGLTRESLKPLLDLQRVDSRIGRLRQLRSDLPEQREVHDLSVERNEIDKVRAEQQEILDGIVREQSRFEGEIQMLDDKIGHEQSRLYGGEITSPKELSNIQAELDALRRRKAHVEDQLLDVMEKRESLEAGVGGLRQRVDELDARIADATSRRDAASIEIEKELGELEAQRASLAPALPPEVLELYEELREKKQGVGAAALEGGVCRGCNVSLSPLAMDAIKRSGNPIVRCENCRRILIPV